VPVANERVRRGIAEPAPDRSSGAHSHEGLCHKRKSRRARGAGRGSGSSARLKIEALVRADDCEGRIDARVSVIDVVEHAALETARVGIVFFAGDVTVRLV
jgi:hypothetical protein